MRSRKAFRLWCSRDMNGLKIPADPVADERFRRRQQRGAFP
jgi:hypothetical protein